MRLLPAVLLSLLAPCLVFSQTYTISTFAGGGAPVNVPGTSAGLGRIGPQYIAADRTGNVFFVHQNTVLRLDATTGILTLLAGNGTTGYSGDNGPATSAQLNNPQGIAVDSSGNLYIADTVNNCIRKVTNGVITTVAGNGTPGFSGDTGPAPSAQLYLPRGVVVDSAGSLYIADSDNWRIRKVMNGVITTAAGNGTYGFSGDDGSATSAQLSHPSGVAVDSAGGLYIADSDNRRIRKVTNGVIITVAGSGVPGYSGDNGPATSAQLNDPQGIAVDSSGNLYIADGTYRIRKVSNGVIITVAGNGTCCFSGDNGPATSAQLNLPVGVAVDSAGNLYIADTINSRIRKVRNGVITTVAGNGTYGFSGDNGPATSAELAYPDGPTVDSSGNLYIADSYNNWVRKVSNGVITTVAGNGTYGFSGDNGPATSAELSWPYGVAADSAGNLYIADYNNNRVRRVSNGVITTVAGGGTSNPGDNGPATSAQLTVPTGVTVDSAGNLYFADTGYQRIRKVSNGVITTVAGGGTSYPGDNGPATSAVLAFPRGIAVDAVGNLFIADSLNFRIRKVSNGVITTVAGNGTYGYSGDNGPATSAQLDQPYGVAVDSAGNLYIADTGNQRIRKVSNGVITTVAGNGTYGFSGDNGPATSAQLANPSGLAVDSGGKVYVADTENYRVRVLTPTGPSCTYSVSPTTMQAPASGGNLTVSIQTTAACTWTVSGLPGWINASGTSSGPGSGSVTLTVAVNSGALRSATFSIAGVSVQVTQQSTTVPSINTGAVVNAASFAAGSPVAPGSIATVFGNFLVSSLTTSSGTPLPNNLAGLSMQFGSGVKVPLFAVSSGQVNFQVPWELAVQSQSPLSATINGQTSGAQTVNLAVFAPGIFSMNAQGTGQGAILDASYRLVDSSNPATAGSTVIQIFCTGLGSVTNQPASGSAALSNPPSSTTTTPTVMIGGAQASVQFSGLAPGSVGEYQVNALVPAGSAKGSAVPVVISIGGATSNTVTIAVQ